MEFVEFCATVVEYVCVLFICSTFRFYAKNFAMSKYHVCQPGKSDFAHHNVDQRISVEAGSVQFMPLEMMMMMPAHVGKFYEWRPGAPLQMRTLPYGNGRVPSTMGLAFSSDSCRTG